MLTISPARDSEYHAHGAERPVRSEWLMLGPPVGPLRALRDGDPVLETPYRRLFEGRDPADGRIVARRRRPPDGTVPPPPGGIDLQFSLPKSVSILAELGDIAEPGLATAIRHLHATAVRRTLKAAAESGLLVTGRGAGRTPAASVAVALFAHRISRAGDPQSHFHAVTLKSAVRADGQVRQLDNHLLAKWKGALAALARNEEARLLRDEVGVHPVPDRRGYTLAGCPAALVRRFSKRRAAIEESAATQNIKNLASRRRAAQMIAWSTRPEKPELEGFELERRWLTESNEAGWTPFDLLGAMRAPPRSTARPLDPPQLHAEALRRLRALCREEVSEDWRRARAVFEAAQCACIGADAAIELLQRVEAEFQAERPAPASEAPTCEPSTAEEVEDPPAPAPTPPASAPRRRPDPDTPVPSPSL